MFVASPDCILMNLLCENFVHPFFLRGSLREPIHAASLLFTSHHCNTANLRISAEFRFTMLSAAMAGLLTVGAVQTSLLYRITPKNYTNTVLNMDTGDIPGDTAFGIYGMSFPFWCKQNPNWINCKNVPILSIPNFNVYESYHIEHDSRFGGYSLCNPNPDTGIFECETSSQAGCWYDAPNAKEWESMCDRALCRCEDYDVKAVGRELDPLGMFPVFPPHTPTQCEPLFVTLGVTYTDVPSFVHKNVSETDCCDLCKKGAEVCAYSQNSTCALWDTHPRHPAAQVDTTLFYNANLNGTAGYWLRKTGVLSKKIGGSWFSTREEGECKEGQQVGKDCYWKTVGTGRTVNATCVEDNIVRYVRDKHPSCWDGCGKGYKLSDECSIRCLFEAGANPAVSAADIVGGFNTSFAHKTPEQYGCPDWTPDALV